MIAVLLLLGALPLASPLAPPPTFASSVESVYVDVIVTSGQRPVTGLVAEDFELKDNGLRRPVELVAVESLPTTTVMVLDTSRSVEGEKIRNLRSAAHALLAGLRPDDKAALLAFDHEVRLLAPPTTDRARLDAQVRALQPRGSTALFDAIYAGAMIASDRERKLLVLFTDGDDNMSWLDAPRVERVLQESNLLLQTVGFALPEVVHPDGRREKPPETEHARTLRRLAEVTGGSFWSANDPADLTATFQRIVEAMKHRYVLRFDPPADEPGLHELSVKLTSRGGKVQCRKAYFLAPRPPR